MDFACSLVPVPPSTNETKRHDSMLANACYALLNVHDRVWFIY